MKNTSLNFLDQLKCGFFFFLTLTAKATECLLTTAYLSFHRIRSKGDWCRGPTCGPLSTQGGLPRLSAAPGGPRSMQICISLCVNRVVQSSTWDWQEARLNKGTAQKVRTTLCRESEPLMPRPSMFYALVSGSCSGAAGSFRSLLGWPWIPSHVMPWLCSLLEPQASLVAMVARDYRLVAYFWVDGATVLYLQTSLAACGPSNS